MPSCRMTAPSWARNNFLTAWILGQLHLTASLLGHPRCVCARKSVNDYCDKDGLACAQWHANSCCSNDFS